MAFVGALATATDNFETSVSGSIATGSGANRWIVGFVGQSTDSTDRITAASQITLASSSTGVTLAGTATTPAGQTAHKCRWFTIEVPSGTTGTVTLQLTASGFTGRRLQIVAACYDATSGTRTPVYGSTSFDTNPTATVTSASGEEVVLFTSSPTSSQTLTPGTGSSNITGASFTTASSLAGIRENGATSVTIDGTYSGSQEYCCVAFSLQPAATGDTITPSSGSIVVTAKQPGVYVNRSLRPIYVGSTTAVLSNSTNASYNVSLTGLTGGVDTQPRTGDLVIVGTGFTGVANGTPGVTTPNDYTEVGFTGGGWADDTRDANLWVGWKKQGTSPDTSLTVTAGGSASYGNATVVHVWRGVDWLSPMDVTVPAGSTTINVSRPDPPSITPVTAGAVVVTVGGGTGATAQTAMTAPSNYTNVRTAIGDGSTGDFEAVIASWNRWTSGAHDAAAWTGGTTSTSDSACAVSLALRPGLYIEPPTQDTLVLLGAAPTVQQNSAASPTITPNSSSIVLTGSAPSAGLGVTLIRPGAASLVFTGSLPVQTYTLPAPAAAAIVLTGYAPSLTVGSPTVTITPAAGAMVLASTAPALSLTVRPGAAAVVLTGTAPTLAGQIAVPAGALTLSGTAPSALVSLRVQPPDAAMVLTGAAPSIQAGNSFAITPPAGSVTLAGVAPSLAYSWLIRPASGALAMTGTAPSAQITSASTIVPNASAVVLTGSAPGVGSMIRPAAGATAITGAAPTVIVPITVTPGAGAVVLAGVAPTVLRTLTVTVPDATVLLAGAAPTATVTTLAVKFPAPAALVLSGAAPTAALSDFKTIAVPAAAVLLAAAAPIIVVGTVSLPRSRRLGRRVAEPTMAETGLAYSAGRVGPTVLRKRTGVLA